MTTQPADEATTDLAAATTDAGVHLTDAEAVAADERARLVARALFDHDWLGSTDGNREAVWLMHRDAYLGKARATLPVIARIVAAEHDGCADLLNAAGDAIIAVRASTAQDEGAGEVERLAQAWDDGYNDAVTMARCYGHTDHWENEPTNPHRAVVDRAKGGA